MAQPKSFEGLWKHFVPRDGPPRTAQAIALKAIARVSHEININDCANWGPESEAALDELAKSLTVAGALPTHQTEALSQDIAIIRAAGIAHTKPGSDVGDAVSRLKAAVVSWCNAKLTA